MADATRVLLEAHVAAAEAAVTAAVQANVAGMVQQPAMVAAPLAALALA